MTLPIEFRVKHLTPGQVSSLRALKTDRSAEELMLYVDNLMARRVTALVNEWEHRGMGFIIGLTATRAHTEVREWLKARAKTSKG